LSESTTYVPSRLESLRNRIAPEQSRAARAWLGWSQDDLARRANVSVNTVRNFESGQKPVHSNSTASIQQAIEAGEITLLFDEHGVGAGIVRRDARLEVSKEQR
jgi:DNA-binding transcriptional regulator YiaG